MSKAERLAKKNFQANTVVECVFGSRVKPALGLSVDDYHWTAKVKVIQPIIDRINGCHCYLVDDEKKKVIGIAVAKSHDGYRSLWVNSDDFKSYSNEEEKSKFLAEFRSKLGH